MTPEDKAAFDRLLAQFLQEKGLCINAGFFKRTANLYIGQVLSQYVLDNGVQARV